VKPAPQIVQTVTVGSIVLVLALLVPASPVDAQMAPSRLTPPAQDRRAAPQATPSYQYAPYQRGTDVPQQSGVHVDAHVDAHVNKAERPEPASELQQRQERWHPWESRPDPRWRPSAERYTRPPQQWSR
jgi:hypothetical protein